MEALSPNRTITIAGKPYLLDGSFGTLRAVQEAFRKDIVEILCSIDIMRFDDFVRLIALASTQADARDEIGQAILDEIGTISNDYLILKTELIAWLTVAITPKNGREKKRAAMDEILTKRKVQPLSLGANTENSASVSSDGAPPNSGTPTSGT